MTVLVSCKRDCLEVGEIERYTGINLGKENQILQCNREEYFTDYKKTVVVSIEESEIVEIEAQIVNQRLFGVFELDSTQKEYLISKKLTGVWYKTKQGYVFDEPKIKGDAECNSVLFGDERYMIESMLDMEKMEFTYVYVAL